MRALPRPLDALFFSPVPAWPLALFRIAFTAVLIAYYTDRIAYLDELFGASPARLPDLDMDGESRWSYVQPLHLGPLSPPVVLAMVASFYVAAAALLAGLLARPAAAFLALWIGFRIWFDWTSVFSLEHSALFVLGVLAVSPADRVLSLSHWWRRRRAGPDTPREDPFAVEVPGWASVTLRSLLLTWYVLAGLSKLAGAWSLVPSDDVLYGHLQGWYQNDLAFWALQNVPRAWFRVLQQLSLYFEVFAPLWLLPYRLRRFGMLVGIGMHVSVAVLMTKLWFFSAEMMSFYLLFLPLRRRRGSLPSERGLG